MDPVAFKLDATELVEYISQLWVRLQRRQLPVLPDFSILKPGYLLSQLPQEPPEERETIDMILKDFEEKILPGITHWQHPNFHAYYPTSCSYPACLGDLLISSLGIVPFSWIASPASTELEVITLNWLAGAMGLPEKFLYKPNSNKTGGGVIEVSAGLACHTLVVAVKEQAIRDHTFENEFTDDDCLNGRGPGSLTDRMVAYVSDQAHSSVDRSIRLAQLKCRVIESVRCGQTLQFNADRLAQAITEDREKGFIPILCVATVGTTTTCEFDDLEAIGSICEKEKIWFHVDAAYAGALLLCPEYRHLATGIDVNPRSVEQENKQLYPCFNLHRESSPYANSISFNPHKLMMTNFDCSVLWVDNYPCLTRTFNTEPIYLKHEFRGMPDYKGFDILAMLIMFITIPIEQITVVGKTVPCRSSVKGYGTFVLGQLCGVRTERNQATGWGFNLGRRFRSLKLWFVFRLFGMAEIRRVIRKHVQLAKEFESLLSENPDFTIVNDVQAGLVCFQAKNSNEITQALDKEIKRSAKIFMVPGSFKTADPKIPATFFLRFVTSHQASSEDVQRAVEVISTALENSTAKEGGI